MGSLGPKTKTYECLEKRLKQNKRLAVTLHLHLRVSESHHSESRLLDSGSLTDLLRAGFLQRSFASHLPKPDRSSPDSPAVGSADKVGRGELAVVARRSSYARRPTVLQKRDGCVIASYVTHILAEARMLCWKERAETSVSHARLGRVAPDVSSVQRIRCNFGGPKIFPRPKR